MADIFDIDMIQNVKPPVSSKLIPSVPTWTVEYARNNRWERKSFLDVTKAYKFYKQITDSLSARLLQHEHN